MLVEGGEHGVLAARMASQVIKAYVEKKRTRADAGRQGQRLPAASRRKSPPSWHDGDAKQCPTSCRPDASPSPPTAEPKPVNGGSGRRATTADKPAGCSSGSDGIARRDGRIPRCDGLPPGRRSRRRLTPCRATSCRPEDSCRHHAPQRSLPPAVAFQRGSREPLHLAFAISTGCCWCSC